ncbi:chaplin [Mangrovactinospora gilvigrisea]|uniref:Chaplin n=1 Tax=Mangrovactinospora gilvigrisea TaxID=1428644 RepID=A0A1J7BK76_9ACTN|nr:chaplin family protein [Mangrovactinospora gilvigrisea]OIV39091.1 chaplin [Mangrovactinospora gilvigrisea]
MRVLKYAAAAGAGAALVAAGAGVASASSAAGGMAAGSPGAISGNLVQVPVHVPVNVVGNTVTGIGGLNPTFGNGGANG